jgi:hypothetical protein
LVPGVPEDPSPSFVKRLKDAIADGWEGLSDFLISLLHGWPLLIFAGMVAWWIRKTIRSAKMLAVPVQSKEEPVK